MSLQSQWLCRSFITGRHDFYMHHARSIHLSRPCLKSAQDKGKPATAPPPQGPPKSAAKDNAKDTLKLLGRPLGVRQRPTTVERTRTERMKDLLDTETRMAQRKHLIKEAGKGYFHDLNMTRKHGGKTWIAPSVLIREDKSLYLPNISGKSLDNGTKKDTTTMCFQKISVIAMLGTQVSEIHTKSFIEPTLQQFSGNPYFQYIQINLQENLLKSFLVKLFSSGLRAAIPPEHQPNYLVSTQNMEYLREPLGLTNSRVGYVYLVDENLRIRWGGCADATPQEAQSLLNCTGVLLQRLKESPPVPVKPDLKPDAQPASP